MARPKGSIDKTKRKPRIEFSHREHQYIRKNWNKMPLSRIAKDLNRPKSSVRSVAKKLGFFGDTLNFVSTKLIQSKFSGVYGIVHPVLQKIYIGSSVDCEKRFLAHIYQLRNGTHPNTDLSRLSKHQQSELYFTVLERCKEEELLERESFWMNKFQKKTIFNKWTYNDGSVEGWLKSPNLKKQLKNYQVDENECWNYMGKNEYGKISVSIDGIRKYFAAHRVAYYLYYNEYPGLVRHLCNNKGCINPDHLAPGSYRQNNVDTHAELYEKFERVWLECGQDREKTILAMGWKNKVSYYPLLKKLDLRNKYKKILKPISLGSRGPRRKSWVGRKKNGFTCMEEFVSEKNHLWVCDDCSYQRITTAHCLKIGCKECKKKETGRVRKIVSSKIRESENRVAFLEDKQGWSLPRWCIFFEVDYSGKENISYSWWKY